MFRPDLMLIKHINPFNISELIVKLFALSLNSISKKLDLRHYKWRLLYSIIPSLLWTRILITVLLISNNLTNNYLQETHSQTDDVLIQDNEFPMFLHCLKKKKKTQQHPLMLILQCLAFVIIRLVSGLIVPGTDGNSVCVICDLLPTVPPDGENCP